MTETTTTAPTGRTLSPWHVDYYAETLSRFAAESAARQIAIGVTRGDYTAADAEAITLAADRQRQFHADMFALIHRCTAVTDTRGVTHHFDSPPCPVHPAGITRLF